MTNIVRLLKEGVEVDKPIKILHIDPDFKVTYFIKHPGSIIQSLVPLKQAIQLMKTEEFDLILSEPHNKAIWDPQSHMDSSQLRKMQN
jgi:hypothetical protein